MTADDRDYVRSMMVAHLAMLRATVERARDEVGASIDWLERRGYSWTAAERAEAKSRIKAERASVRAAREAVRRHLEVMRRMEAE